MEPTTLALYVSLTVAVIGGLGMLTLRHPVHSAMSLLLTMLSLSVAYAMLQAHLLAALQIIIYAGAIIILILYVIMLLDAGSDDDKHVFRKAGKVGLPALLGFFVFAGAQLATAPAAGPAALDLRAESTGPEGKCDDQRDGDGDGLIDCGDADCARNTTCYGTVRAVGQALLGPYVLPFELSSILLLGGIVGALLLTVRRPTTAAAAQEAAEQKTHSPGNHVDAA